MAILSALAAAAGCGDDGGGGGDELANLPALAALPAGEWSALEPGGATTCSGGTPFRFYVWPGRTDRLVMNFIGGGGCWNESTCRAGTFTPDVSQTDAVLASGETFGIFDMEDAANPVGDYTHVVVPYCTGDVHWGDATTEYADDLVIEHRGAVNARLVLAWVGAHVEATDRVLTTGCSAGGYGASLWGAYLMDRYREAHHVLLADSSAGVITPEFFDESFPNWNATAAFPRFVPGYDPDEVDSLTTVYTAFADHFPDAVFAQYNTRRDWNQALFYAIMGGEGGVNAWSEGMRENLGAIAAGTPGFRYFVGGDDPATDDLDESTVHCVINGDPGNPQFGADGDRSFARTSRMYLEYEEGGVRFVDWLGGLLEPDADPGSVACEGCAPISPTR